MKWIVERGSKWGGELSCTPRKLGGGNGGERGVGRARACVGKEEPPVKAKRVFYIFELVCTF